MKKTVGIILAALIMSACQTYNINSAMEAARRPVITKLPDMELVYEAGVTGEKGYETIFDNEAKENLITAGGEKRGRIVVRSVEQKLISPERQAWILLAPFGLFGAPLRQAKISGEISVEVRDTENNVVKSYTAYSEDKFFAAMWWGYSFKSLNDAARYENYRTALGRIIDDIAADGYYITKRLNGEEVNAEQNRMYKEAYKKTAAGN